MAVVGKVVAATVIITFADFCCSFCCRCYCCRCCCLLLLLLLLLASVTTGAAVGSVAGIGIVFTPICGRCCCGLSCCYGSCCSSFLCLLLMLHLFAVNLAVAVDVSDTAVVDASGFFLVLLLLQLPYAFITLSCS